MEDNVDMRRAGFSDLFGATWRALMSNYGLQLGYGAVFILMVLGSAILVLVVGLFLQSYFFKPGDLGAVMIGAAINLFLGVVIIYPVVAYLHYGILRRLRGSTEARKRGRYAVILVISIIQGCLMAPSVFVQAAARPGEFANLILDFEVTGAAVKVNAEQGAETAEQKRAKADALKERLDTERIPTNVGLSVLAGVLGIMGGVVALLWIPWAYVAALDPRTNVTTAAEALQYGGMLCAGSRGPMYGAGFVLLLIICVSVILCCLPAVFFGIPLAIGAVPAFYMTMRGESAGASAPPVA